MKDLRRYINLAHKVARELWSGSEEWEKYIEEKDVREELRGRLDGSELEKRWSEFEGIDIKQALEKVNSKRKVRRVRRIRRIGWSGAAAVAAGLIIVSWVNRSEPVVMQEMVAIGGEHTGAYLVVGDTGRVDLATAVTFENQGVIVSNTKKEELSYRENVREVEAPLIHKLVIPKGCEYKLVLADGTRVWMNAESELSYPVAFSGDSRVVSLKGQAYFEVAKSGVPFIVRTEQVDVRVLGTSFDVMSYSDEPTVQVTLEEGKVQVHTGVRDELLVPGQQAVFALGDSTLSVREVCTEVYTGWRKGEFIFDGESFAGIGRKLSRWYDIEVVIDEKLQNESLFGSLIRYESIQEFLNILQLTNEIKVVYYDDKIEILSKEKEEL